MFHRLLLLATLALSAQPPRDGPRDEQDKATPANEVTIVVPRDSDLTPDELQRLAVAVARFSSKADRAEDIVPAADDELYISGHEYLWLDPRDAWIAEAIETTAREVALGLVELSFAEGALEITDRGDSVVLKIDQRESVRLLVLERTPDGLITVMAGRHWKATADADARLEMQIVNGEVNVSRLRREADELPDPGIVATTSDCAASGNGVCCSFQDGSSVRIVCMCYSHNGQAGPRFTLCSDTGWMK